MVVSIHLKEDDLPYAKSPLRVGTSGASDETHKILGVQWNPRRDVFVFDITDVTGHEHTATYKEECRKYDSLLL